MAASRPPTPQSTASSIIPLLHQSQFLPDLATLQRRLQMIFEGARERWVYAIYWRYSPTDSLFCWGPSATHNYCDQDVTDPEWLFLLSPSHTFVNGSGVLGQAFFHPRTVWLTGSAQLSESACQRARQLQQSGLQTMVCIPCPNGVVELASSEVVLPNPDFVIKVRDLFNFNDPVADLTSAEIIPPR
ncbi:hypothetical protein ACSQ67_000487 [Phaseolus vulgaris]